MSEEADAVRRHYETETDEDTRLRGGLGRIELWRVQDMVRRYLGAGSRRVLDVGGASGVHSEWLLGDSHTVHLVDLVERHVAAARDRLEGVPGFSASVGDARQLPVADASQDAVLLLGPLYHVQDREDRVAIWREAARVLSPGGVVVAMAISRFASLFDGLTHGYLFDPEFRAVVDADLTDGRHENAHGRPGWFTTAYFHRPEELAVEAADAGLDVLETLGVEGIAGWIDHLAPRLDDAADREVVLEAARRVEAEPSLLGLSPHLLCVARRPD
ncbi:class I SAM-dependent methyltransferase [Actinotalea sp. M2MS4P-6]|uniref:class I SAM-dependent methyltransferase n=1 Tax=Actinotalea sp. M2MS4P-6 TaxID=2983762 RepID=UPI0021E3B098|nr:class I SAM-dependent methyltransferase [Actinotalea sp. M2MS4P-6]MCV2393644.1 class I SAM-dependent methyltransferase [Actinotalea sp. M2MS4P-6]